MFFLLDYTQLHSYCSPHTKTEFTPPLGMNIDSHGGDLLSVICLYISEQSFTRKVGGAGGMRGLKRRNTSMVGQE